MSRGGFFGSHPRAPRDRRPPPLLTRWAWPPPRWLSSIPQIRRSSQDPSLPYLPQLALGFPGHRRGGNDHLVQVMVWEMGNRGSERACDWPEVSQRNLAWTQHVSPQNCCPLQGEASASLSHMPVASLAMKVIGRKLGFGKRVREGDNSGRGGCQLSASSSPSRPAPIWPPAPGGRHPLSFSAPQKPSLPPLSCGSLRGSRHCLPP